MKLIDLYPGPFVKTSEGYMPMTDRETTFEYLKLYAEEFLGDKLVEWKLEMMEEKNPSLRFLDGIQDKIGIDYNTNQPIYKKRE